MCMPWSPVEKRKPAYRWRNPLKGKNTEPTLNSFDADQEAKDFLMPFELQTAADGVKLSLAGRLGVQPARSLWDALRPAHPPAAGGSATVALTRSIPHRSLLRALAWPRGKTPEPSFIPPIAQKTKNKTSSAICETGSRSVEGPSCGPATSRCRWV